MAADDQNFIVLSSSEPALPPLIAAGDHAARRFIEFFTSTITSTIRNPNTPEAYSRTINAFVAWCYTEANTALDMIERVAIAAYVEKLLNDGLSKPTVKQHLAAICHGGEP